MPFVVYASRVLQEFLASRAAIVTAEAWLLAAEAGVEAADLA